MFGPSVPTCTLPLPKRKGRYYLASNRFFIDAVEFARSAPRCMQGPERYLAGYLGIETRTIICDTYNSAISVLLDNFLDISVLIDTSPACIALTQSRAIAGPPRRQRRAVRPPPTSACYLFASAPSHSVLQSCMAAQSRAQPAAPRSALPAVPI